MNQRTYARDTPPILRRNAKNARRRRDGDDGLPADEAVPTTPELPKTFKPFTDEQQKHIDEFTEAFNHYSRVLQYILTKVTKGEPTLQVCSTVQSQQRQRIRDLEEIT
eukprot:1405613-Amphidinium_carterae.1